MSHIKTKIALAGSGIILSGIGAALMIAPQAFLELSDVIVQRDPGLMSELSAPGGLLLIAGAIMIVGAVKRHFANLGLVVGALVYGSYGFGRITSMVLHGVPSQSLISATFIELAIAIWLAMLFVKQGSAERRGLAELLSEEVTL